MRSAAVQIRSRRLAAGLTQRELARRAGTSSATLCRYESGMIDPSVGTLGRILDATLPRRRRWACLADLASPLHDALTGTGAVLPWRLVAEFLDDDAHADDHEAELVVSEAPDPTGDPRVDALMAALAEYLCVRRGLIPPAWTQMSVEAVPWWFVAGSAFSAMAIRESPISFARRGVFITAGALERI